MSRWAGDTGGKGGYYRAARTGWMWASGDWNKRGKSVKRKRKELEEVVMWSEGGEEDGSAVRNRD